MEPLEGTYSGTVLVPDLAGIVAGAVLIEEGLEPAALWLGHPNGGQILVHNILELTHIVNLHQRYPGN